MDCQSGVVLQRIYHLLLGEIEVRGIEAVICANASADSLGIKSYRN